LELAAAALAAQGGDKFKNLKSMYLYGSANLYAPTSSQSIPGKFVMVTAGDKVRIDIDASPIFKFKQVYDGQQSYSSMPGVNMPPASKFGLSVLAKYNQPGYTVSALPNEKKLRGFRIVDSEGNTTDFFIDPATARVTKYLTPYEGRYVWTENIQNSLRLRACCIPVSFSQRLGNAGGRRLLCRIQSERQLSWNQPHRRTTCFVIAVVGIFSTASANGRNADFTLVTESEVRTVGAGELRLRHVINGYGVGTVLLLVGIDVRFGGSVSCLVQVHTTFEIQHNLTVKTCRCTRRNKGWRRWGSANPIGAPLVAT
jgi:hypothetical protein